jgi:histidyl-tRNA synthetase
VVRRSREFFQWNLDLLGIESPEADAEVVAMGAELLRGLGLSPDAVRILVNDRRLAESLLDEIGIDPERHASTLRLIDRRDRMSVEKWADWSLREGLSQNELNALQGLLDDRDSWRTSESLIRFFAATQSLGVSEYVTYDPTVIRGLDYYTGIVFEARDPSRRFRAVFGGGRYDDLISALGGDPVPGTGLAMGDVAIRLVLEEHGAAPALDSRPAQVLLTTFDEGSLIPTLRLASELRSSGLAVEWYPAADTLVKQLRYANRTGSRVAVILGPDEISAGMVAIRDLKSGKQRSVARREAAAYVKRLVESPP